jgi:hypothetical protein
MFVAKADSFLNALSDGVIDFGGGRGPSQNFSYAGADGAHEKVGVFAAGEQHD